MIAMRHSALLILIALIVSLSSCRKDFEFEPSTGDLEFSRDTVYLDTVFSNIGSSTYTLKVYNRGDKDILIPSVKLDKIDSKYRMTVDGMTGEDADGNGVGDGRVFRNVELLARDSMYIFIETTASIADANTDDFLYTDQIQFDAGANLQTVELVTLIQDAVFLYPQRFEDNTYEQVPIGVDEDGEVISGRGFYLEGSELSWTSEKPYVIYGYAGVPAGQTLNIGPGTRVHFHDGSALIAYNGAEINVNGTTDAPAIFEGDRLEPEFSDVPGQWLTIWLTQGSRANLNNAIIKNATVGLLVSGNDGSNDTVQLNNVQIYGAANYGILAYTGHIRGENVVIGSSGQACLAGTFGGQYRFVHSTFNNNWISSRQVAVLLTSYSVNPDQSLSYAALDDATFINCILYGSNQNELLIDKKQSAETFNYLFDHCMIRLSNQVQQNELYNDPTRFISPFYSTGFGANTPDFWNAQSDNLRITDQSDAIGKANAAFLIPFDVEGTARTTNDLGAFQSAPVPEEN